MLTGIAISAAFFITLALIVALVPVAHRIGLLDVPGSRKCHEKPTPLVGGVAIFLVVLAMAAFAGQISGTGAWFLLGGGLLVAVGALDDRSHLPVALRAAIEVAAATIMVFGGGVAVSSVGDLFAVGVIGFPLWIAYPFTVVAVFGIINALNMMDGLDGLCAGVSLAALAVLFGFGYAATPVASLAQIMMPCLVAFILCNCSLVPGLPKVFLGDAGSKFIGFALVWLLIEAAQPAFAGEGAIPPVTALYFIGLPLMDMVATTLKRLRRGVSPFHPDRTHLHHVLMDRLGLSRKTAALAVIALAAVINLVGVAMMRVGVAEVVQFAVFCVLFLLLLVFKHVCLTRVVPPALRHAA